MSRKKLQPLISRTIADANFAHVLSLFPFARMWAAAVEPGHRIDFNDRNMIHIPVEIAEALIRERVQHADEIGIACQKVVAAIDGDDPLFAADTVTNTQAQAAE